MGRFFRALFGFFFVPLLLLGLIWGSVSCVALSTKPYRYTSPDQAPSEEVAVVFGAGVIQRTGEVGAVLKGRMDTAIKLYTSGKVTKIVLSGDNRTKEYDEVTPMESYALANGVAEEDIILDPKGSSTYDTCYRINHTFHIKKAALVTNDFHLPRAVFTCRKLGVEAVGVATPNYAGYEYNRNQRESLATVKMLLDLYVASPVPAD